MLTVTSLENFRFYSLFYEITFNYLRKLCVLSWNYKLFILNFSFSYSNHSFPQSEKEEMELSLQRDLFSYYQEDVAKDRLKRTKIMWEVAKLESILKKNEIENDDFTKKIMYFQEKIMDYNV